MQLRPGFAIDLGTVNTLVHVIGSGLVVDEPSVIALDRATGKVAVVGSMACALSGKEPEGIKIIWPLRDGVIADYEAATLMLKAFLQRVHVRRGLVRRSAVICVPRGATAVERRAVQSSVEEQHPHCAVRLVEEPVAAAIGAGAVPSTGEGAFLVDVGGGTTDIAVVAGGRVVRALSLRIAGNAMDEGVAHAVKTSFGLRIGHKASERLKIALGLTGGAIGCAQVFGVDVASEKIRSEQIPGHLVAGALQRQVKAIVAGVHEVISAIPPDLAQDVLKGTIEMAGGGALLLGLAHEIEMSTGIETTVVHDPLRCVVRGAAEILQHGDWIHGSRVA